MISLTRLIYSLFKTFTLQGAIEWLQTPNPKLNNRKPIACLGSKEDINRVRDVLAGIQHGLPA
jgi:uncharacterized protein (DUF2384 family)